MIILAITSQVRPEKGVGETSITEWREAGLLKPSVLEPVLTTLEQGLMRRRLGTLAEADRDALRELRREILGV